MMSVRENTRKNRPLPAKRKKVQLVVKVNAACSDKHCGGNCPSIFYGPWVKEYVCTRFLDPKGTRPTLEWDEEELACLRCDQCFRAESGEVLLVVP